MFAGSASNRHNNLSTDKTYIVENIQKIELMHSIDETCGRVTIFLKVKGFEKARYYPAKDGLRPWIYVDDMTQIVVTPTQYGDAFGRICTILPGGWSLHEEEVPLKICAFRLMHRKLEFDSLLTKLQK